MAPLIVIFTVGLAAMVGQVLIIRDLMGLFGGSELASATVFSAWLGWTALGAALGGRAAKDASRAAAALILACVVLALALPGALVLARAGRIIWNIPGGETVGPLGIAALSFAVLFLPCLPNGMAFTLAVGLAREEETGRARAVGRVFAVEALGSATGGLVLYLVLLPRLPALASGALAGMAVVLGSTPLFLRHRGKFARILVPAALVFMAAFLFLVPSLKRATKSWQWPGYRLMASKETVYGSLALIDRGDQVSLFENGLFSFSHPDILSREDAVHYALLMHPEPESVLLLGSGVSGTVSEVLKHKSVSRVDYVELDPGLITFAKENLPKELTGPLASRRVKVHSMDARLFIRRAETRYDVVIGNLPDPVNLQLNRYYTVEFFAAVKKILKPRGIFSFSAQSSENVVGPQEAGYLASLLFTLKEVFPETAVLPGARARFFGARKKGLLTTDPATLLKRLETRGLKTRFVAGYYLLADLSPWQVRQLNETLASVKDPALNTDLNPRCYYHDTVLFSLQHNRSLARLLEGLERNFGSVLRWAGLFLAASLVLAAFHVIRRGSPGPPVYLGVFVAGFAQITLEIVALLGFQAAYGNLYLFISVMVAAYMVGTALGGWAGAARAPGLKLPALHLVPINLALGLGALPLVSLFSLGGHSRALYVLVAAAAGFLGGAYFPVASKVLKDQKAGPLYAADLAGAALGSLLVGLVVIPLAGIWGACLGIFVLNLWAAAGLGVLAFKQMTGATG